MSNASHARAMGWGVGTILYGSPIVRDGHIVETGRQWKITALGESVVVIRSRFRYPPNGKWGEWGGESFGDFSSREWSPIARAASDV